MNNDKSGIFKVKRNGNWPDIFEKQEEKII